jgi:hypothetical protein
LSVTSRRLAPNAKGSCEGNTPAPNLSGALALQPNVYCTSTARPVLWAEIWPKTPGDPFS